MGLVGDVSLLGSVPTPPYVVPPDDKKTTFAFGEMSATRRKNSNAGRTFSGTSLHGASANVAGTERHVK